MCGRFVSKMEAAMEYEWMLVHQPPLFESFNIAPSQQVPVIRQKAGGRVLDLLRWGLIPYFAKGVPGKFATHIAKVETVRTLASYRGPWTRGQRCLIVGQGFYEWQLQADGKTKIPYYISVNDQRSFAIAGIWESSKPDAGDAIESVAMITVPANEVLAEIHNSGSHARRMPAILAAEDREAWLTGTPEEAYAVLRQYADEHTVAWPVSTRVNKPAINDATLIEAIA